MTIVYLVLYLFSCLIVLAPLYAASAIAFKPPAVVETAPAKAPEIKAAKRPKDTPKPKSFGDKRPVWIAATREYKIAPTANVAPATKAYAHQIRENKEVKKSKRVSADQKAPPPPALSALSYAEDSRYGSPSLQRD